MEQKKKVLLALAVAVAAGALYKKRCAVSSWWVVLEVLGLVPVDAKERLKRVLRSIDKVNEEDPNVDEGKPKELLYGQRMTEMLASFIASEEKRSDVLEIAARAQHIARWKSPRKSYPEGKAGYHKWRSDLYKFHGNLTYSLMVKEGYPVETAEKVRYILSKEGIKDKDPSKRDKDSQILEDVVCLVFLKYYWKPFSKRGDFDEKKLIGIVQRTWGKMSDDGHAAALKLNYGEEEFAIIQKALGA